MIKKKEGFFESRTVVKKSSKIYNCETCGLIQYKPEDAELKTGKGKERILILGDLSSSQEDYLGKVLEKLDYDLYDDVWVCKPALCNSPKYTNTQLRCCRHYWMSVVEEVKPSSIWLMGEVAFNAFYCNTVKNDQNDSRISASYPSWRKWCIPDKETGTWVLPLLHPEEAMSVKDREGIAERVFFKGVQWALSCNKKAPPVFRKFKKNIISLKNYEDVMDALISIRDGDTVTFDYETTGLKPYRTGHAILSIGLKVDRCEDAVAFPFQWRDIWRGFQFVNITNAWRRVLLNPKIKKIAHNIKFEHTWTKQILGIDIQGWHWDTMVTQHLLDARPKLTGLKTQAFLRFGVEEYNSKVKLNMVAEQANDFNTLGQVELDDLLLYNGMDAILEEALYMEQLKQPLSKEVRVLYLEGSLAFADMEAEGVRTVPDYYTTMRKKLQRRSTNLKNSLSSGIEAKRFKKVTGNELKLTSSKDLGILFYAILKETAIKKTKSDKYSVDVESLGSLGSFKSEFARQLMQMRKLDKLEGTFLKSFEQEDFDGVIHPFFNLHLARSSRSSSDRPNFQNIPNRDKEAMGIVRGGIIPTSGFEIVSADYKQIELVVQSVLSKDPAMMEYVKNPRSDMHRDTAMDTFMLPADAITKPLRHLGKNGFNFPELYGDWYGSIAKTLWKEINKGLVIKDGTLVRTLLKANGIDSYIMFEQHIKKVEDNFWTKFHVTKAWREETLDEYKRKLIVSTPVGFQRNGFLSKNEACNTPVQGTAFHVLLWSLTELNRIRKAEKWRTKIIGQIHDQIVFEIPPDEKHYVVEVIKDVMCNRIRKHYEWLVVPLSVEIECSGVDKKWSFKSEE